MDPEPVWPFWKRETFLAYTGIQTPNCPAPGLVSVPTMLLQFFPRRYLLEILFLYFPQIFSR